MLSDVNIKRELKKKNIAIFPFKPQNIEGCGIYITAGEWAWSLKSKNKISNNRTKNIVIPANDTALVVSDENIFLDKKIAGVCLSRVGLISQGMGPIGAPMKPGYAGRLIISIQNQGNEEFSIKIGTKIAVVMFYELKTTATKGFDQNVPFSNLAETINMKVEDRNTLIQNPMDDNAIKSSMISSSDYKKYMEEKTELKLEIDIWHILGSIGSLLGGLAILMQILGNK
jgi:deoxycytidine triphosphate deaminase